MCKDHTKDSENNRKCRPNANICWNIHLLFSSNHPLINVRECLHDNKSSGTNYTDFMFFINRNNEIRIIYA